MPDIGGLLYNGSKCTTKCQESTGSLNEARICKTCLQIYQEEPLWISGKCASCPGGQYFANSACAENCPSGLLKPAYGQICVKTCGMHQVSDGTKCTCVDGLVPGHDKCIPPAEKSWVDFERPAWPPTWS